MATANQFDVFSVFLFSLQVVDAAAMLYSIPEYYCRMWN
jgi:hypothetical protein